MTERRHRGAGRRTAAASAWSGIALVSLVALACGGGKAQTQAAPTATPSVESASPAGPRPSPSLTAARVATASPAAAIVNTTSTVVSDGGEPAASGPHTDPAPLTPEDPTAPAAHRVDSTASPASGEPPTLVTAITALPSNTPIPVITAVPRPDATFSLAQAQTFLATVFIKPSDLGSDWSTTTDLIQDNATVAAADPTLGASAARCGRLLGRTVVLQPANVVAAYLASRPATAFTQVVVYATAAGAADCGAELRQRYQQPGKLATALGVFDDPASAEMAVADFPTVGSESLAATISGTVTVGPYHAGVNIFLVMFRTGNVVAVVGVARHPNAVYSGAEMLTPILNLLLQRFAS